MNKNSEVENVPAAKGDEQNQETSGSAASQPLAAKLVSSHADALAARYEYYRQLDVPRLHAHGVPDAEGVFDWAFADVLKKRDIDDPLFELCLRTKERDYASDAYKKELRYRERYGALPEGYEELQASEPAQFAHLELVEARGLLDEALSQLPSDEQAMFRLLYWEEVSCEEIAALFARPVGTVKSLLFRARANLRVLLEQAGLKGWN